jgi:flagellar hook protein FlgE
VSVSSEGIISGTYSNGQILDLYQITLANFNNPNGLYKEGSNLYSETLASGVAYTNSPGEGGLGKISANSLEQSNVDLATEFVKMIIAQRGFQANSKVITTTDEILQELMTLKR